MITSGYWAHADDAGVYRHRDVINGVEWRAIIPFTGGQWEGPTRRGVGAERRARRDLAAELELRAWLHQRRQETTT